MAQKRTGLGRGLGALIPSGPVPGQDRPRDVFFRDRTPDAEAGADLAGSAASGAGSEGAGGSNAPVPSALDDRSSGEGWSAKRTGGDDTHAAAPDDPSRPVGSRTARDAGTPAGDRGAADDGDQEAILAPVPGARFALLPVTSIRPNPKQPRTVFDEDELAELVHSIREVGILQPVVVRPVGRHEIESSDVAGNDVDSPGTDDQGADVHGVDVHGADGHDAEGAAYELIMGERRWRATRAAGLDAIPAIVRDTSDDDLLRDALLENLHRSQLNPLEEAAAYQQLLEDFGCTQDVLATRIGRSRPQISNTLRLLKLPPVVQRRVAAGVLSAGHARALLGLSDGAAMERLAQRIVAEGLSVRNVEEIVALGGDSSTTARAPRRSATQPELEDLSAQLSDQLETRVTVTLGQKRGKLSVDFADLDDLHRILDALGIDARTAGA